MKQRLLAICTAIAATLPLGGCGLLDGEDPRETVTVWLMRGSATDAFVERFTTEFERKHTKIALEVKIQEWSGIGPKVTAALKDDDPAAPDVIEVGNTQVAQYVDDGGIEDLSLESMRDWGMDDWLPGLAEPGSYRGAQYGIPWYAANRVVVYRKDLFREAGLKKPPTTREEWLDQTRRLNATGHQGIYLAGQDWYTLAGFIWDEGGELAKESRGRWRGTLHSEEALRGMEFYRQLQQLGNGPTDADEETPPQAGVFAQGEIAQIVAVPSVTKTIEAKNPELKGKIGYFPVPGLDADRPGSVFIGGSDLIVPERSGSKRAAVTVVDALAGREWQTDLARTMDHGPNKTTLAGVVADEPGVAAMAKGAAHGRSAPASPRWGEVEADNPIKRYMTEVLEGADPERAARKASEQITEALWD